MSGVSDNDDWKRPEVSRRLFFQSLTVEASAPDTGNKYNAKAALEKCKIALKQISIIVYSTWTEWTKDTKEH